MEQPGSASDAITGGAPGDRVATAAPLATDGAAQSVGARRTAAAYDWQAVAHRYFATLDLAHRRRLRPLDLPAWPAGAAAG